MPLDYKMLTKSVVLKFYKQREIQQAIVEHASQKEVGMRYMDSFGKRPNTLSYPRDVLELALQGVTSFHASEELWENPLALNSDLPKKELDSLRIGWDLVLDIDCPDWEISKITAYLFIKALKDQGVQDISCKFSGNKGFHIGVPFEAFPKEVAGKKTQELFPDGPKKIALYLLDTIAKSYVSVHDGLITFDNTFSFHLPQLQQKFGNRHFLIHRCQSCKRKITLVKDENHEFICAKCDFTSKTELDFMACPKCHVLMQKIDTKKALCLCGSSTFTTMFDPLSILEIDTVLISSRHLYRMPYSLHEKSGLVSLPIDPHQVLSFEKGMADPLKIITPLYSFLDRSVKGESARKLLLQALDFDVKMTEEKERDQSKKYEEVTITSPITEEFFPDCMKKILLGMEDGKKRGVFCLMNFLGKIGWNKQDIETFLKKWNTEKNRVPLREVYIKGQLSNFKPGERLPPNCDNPDYYQNLGIQCADCKRFKNPVNYTIWRWRRVMREKEATEKKGKSTKEV